MRYDLTFFLCCCKSFLGSDENEEDNYYGLLGIDRDASPEELKRAYKKQSLQMHPDKLAQRGQTVTDADQAKFTRMKEAYEVLSDPHKRETYDAIGARGMKWLEEPFSMDPQELAHNFAKSSVLDRSKIFLIFVGVAVLVLVLPFLICLHVDGAFGQDASWMATLVPLWLWNAFLLFYHGRVILMGPIPKPDHVSEQEWVDPLPMKKRLFSLGRFLLILLFEVLVVLRMDHVLHAPWSVVFFPLYVWELSTIYKKWPLARMRIVTVQDLEAALGKPFSEFTPAEKDLIAVRYSVVPSIESPEYEAAQKSKSRARQDILKSAFRSCFVILLLMQLDGVVEWNWWLVFLPVWILSLVLCGAHYQAFSEVQKRAMEKDPTLFGTPPNSNSSTDPAAANSNPQSYGATTATASGTTAASDNKPQVSPLTDEEREELKAQVMASSSRLCSKCCSQGFVLVLLAAFCAKLQGAGFASMWILSPFLLAATLILCCLGFAIFGITEVPTDGVEFDTADFAYQQAEEGRPSAASSAPSPAIVVPPPYVPPASQATTTTTPAAAVVVPPPVDLLDSKPPEAAAATVTPPTTQPPKLAATGSQIGELD